MANVNVASPTRIILATSNGTGMGHLSRQTAIALALQGRADPVVFSMSPALPMIFRLGLRAEYCPGYHGGALPRHHWDSYLADRIRAIVEETDAKVVLFDGVVPYRGLLSARTSLPHVGFVWVRRALWRTGANARSLRSTPYFDLVLEPGDLAAAADEGPTSARGDAVPLPPVTLVEQVDRLPRADAAAELGLDASRPTALVMVRGRPTGRRGPAAAVIQTLSADPEMQIALPPRLLAVGAAGRARLPNVTVLPAVFPLARYLAAFDFAVIEAGYNSVHETLFARLPSLVIPTSAAVTDNQAARAEWAASGGFALHAAEDDPIGIADAIKQLLDPAVRAELAQRCRELPEPRGATDAASGLLRLAGRFDRHQLTVAERLSRARLFVAPLVEQMLGRQLRDVARRALGRSVDDGPPKRLPVHLTASRRADAPADGVRPLLITDDLTVDGLRRGHPVEHVLAGSSSAYRARRERIARRHYDVRP